MRILYDLISTQPSNDSKFHGGGEYGKIVFKALVKKIKAEYLSCIYDKNKYLDPSIIEIIEKYKIELINIESHKELQTIIDSGKFNKFYSPLPYRYTDIDFKSTQLIFTIHGLRTIETPSDIYQIKYNNRPRAVLQYIYSMIFKKSYKQRKIRDYEKIVKLLNDSPKNKIITVSNHTKYALLNFFPFLDKDRIKVLYSPRKSSIQDTNVDIGKFGVEKSNYILLVSGNRWIKNVYRAVIALDGVFTNLKDTSNKKVLVLGVKNPKMFTKRIKNVDRFVFCDYVSESELESLYKHAYLFIYPTLNEGFGYPPLESMKYGVPVISSAITSIPEICKDGVVYFNPYCIDELRNRVLCLLTDKKIWKEFSVKGFRVYNEVSQKQDKMLDELVDLILS